MKDGEDLVVPAEVRSGTAALLYQHNTQKSRDIRSSGWRTVAKSLATSPRLQGVLVQEACVAWLACSLQAGEDDRVEIERVLSSSRAKDRARMLDAARHARGTGSHSLTEEATAWASGRRSVDAARDALGTEAGRKEAAEVVGSRWLVDAVGWLVGAEGSSEGSALGSKGGRQPQEMEGVYEGLEQGVSYGRDGGTVDEGEGEEGGGLWLTDRQRQARAAAARADHVACVATRLGAQDLLQARCSLEFDESSGPLLARVQSAEGFDALCQELGAVGMAAVGAKRGMDEGRELEVEVEVEAAGGEALGGEGEEGLGAVLARAVRECRRAQLAGCVVLALLLETEARGLEADGRQGLALARRRLAGCLRGLVRARLGMGTGTSSVEGAESCGRGFVEGPEIGNGVRGPVLGWSLVEQAVSGQSPMELHSRDKATAPDASGTDIRGAHLRAHSSMTRERNPLAVLTHPGAAGEWLRTDAVLIERAIGVV